MILLQTNTGLIQVPPTEPDLIKLRKNSKDMYEIVFWGAPQHSISLPTDEADAQKHFQKLVGNAAAIIARQNFNAVININDLWQETVLALTAPAQTFDEKYNAKHNKPSKSKTNKKDDNDVNESR